MNNQICTRTWLSRRSDRPNLHSKRRDPLEVKGSGSHGGS